MEKMKRERRKRDEKRRVYVSVLLILVMLFCLGRAGWQTYKNVHAQGVYEEIKEQSIEGMEVTEAEETESGQQSYDEAEIPSVDFEKLWETNTDVCAWIYVPGTEVDYPILRNADTSDMHDSYYLNHTIEGVAGLPGSIYIEPCNVGDFTDSNTVVYGHSMKNRTMFGSLREFMDAEFFEEHPYIYVVTPEKSLVYEIARQAVYDDRHIMATYDFEDEGDYEAFLESLSEQEGNIREEVPVTTDSRLITLSTCMSNDGDSRLLIIGVLTEELER